VEVSRSWFIDAWAVRDGVAFASRRFDNSVDATNTIFMSVPALEPIPVGRITTALGATRGCFQAGLFGTDGHEIAFDDLNQIRELIRRGYLASGIGPGGAAAPAPVGPLPEPGGIGGAYYETAISRDVELAGSRWLDEGGEAATSLASAFSVSHQLHRVGQLVKAFAEATIVEWERAVESGLATDSPDGRRDRYRAMGGLYDWYATLASRGVWNNVPEMARFIDINQLPFGHHIYYRFAEFDFIFGMPRRTYSDHELLTMAPCPLRSNWDHRIRRLSDKVFLALSDASYFESNPHVAELAPALLASLVSVRAMTNVVLGVEAGIEFDDRLRDSLAWLSRELPSVELPTMAEMFLQKYIWSMLDQAQDA
jgi:hypothetical protein